MHTQDAERELEVSLIVGDCVDVVKANLHHEEVVVAKVECQARVSCDTTTSCMRSSDFSELGPRLSRTYLQRLPKDSYTLCESIGGSTSGGKSKLDDVPIVCTACSTTAFLDHGKRSRART